MITSSKAYFALLLFFATTINFYGQQIAMTNVKETNKTYSLESKFNRALNTVLQDGTYTFRLNSNDILVTIDGDSYIEEHPNNEFIKAKINWDSNTEYTLTIVEIEKRNLPFKPGEKLTTTITEVKGNKFYYNASLDNKDWTGKFKKIE